MMLAIIEAPTAEAPEVAVQRRQPLNGIWSSIGLNCPMMAL